MIIDEKEFARELAINLRRLMYEKQVEQKDIANALMPMRLIRDIKKDPRRSESLWG